MTDDSHIEELIQGIWTPSAFTQGFGRSQRRTTWQQCRKLEQWLWDRYRFRVPMERGESPFAKLVPLYRWQQEAIDMFSSSPFGMAYAPGTGKDIKYRLRNPRKELENDNL